MFFGDLHKQCPSQASVMCWIGARELACLASSRSPEDSQTASSIAAGRLIYGCEGEMERWVKARVTVSEQEMEAIWPFPIFDIKTDWFYSFFFFVWKSRRWCGGWLSHKMSKLSRISEIGSTKHKLRIVKNRTWNKILFNGLSQLLVLLLIYYKLLSY